LLTSQVKNMVQQIPVVWDETVVLPQSEIGELVLLAKRKGRDWYLIALNGETPKSLSIKLNFLGP
jgi:alpha-glucosidase